MEAERRRILLVQDGSELVRQRHADTARYFENLLANGYLATRNIQVSTVLDSKVDQALAGIDPADFACVVLSSNALIRPDGAIRQSFERRKPDLERYVRGGGGIVSFHQSFAENELTIDIPGIGQVTTVARRDYRTAERGVFARSASSLKHFPNELDESEFVESEDSLWRGNFPLAYRELSVAADSSLEPVIEFAGGGALLLAGGHQGRAVTTSMPCDWAQFDSLIENILAYVIDGLPEVVILGRGDSSDPADTQLTLSRFSGEMPVMRLNDSSEEVLSVNSQFLLHNSALCLYLSSSEQRDPTDDPMLLGYVRAGGTVAHMPGGVNLGYQTVTLYLGSRFGHEVAAAILDELAILNLPEWSQSALVFDLRDVWLAQQAACDFLGGGEPVTSAAVEALVRRCEGWLRVEGQFNLDISTGVLVLWLLLGFGQAGDSDTMLSKFGPAMDREDLPLETEFLRRVMFERDGAWSWLAGHDLSTITDAGVVRLLDAVRCALSSATSVRPSGADAGHIVDSLAEALDDADFSETHGWISIDATASIVAGFSCLLVGVSGRDSGVSVLARASKCLVRYYRNDHESAGPSNLRDLRVAEALTRLESVFPVGAYAALRRLVGDGAKERALTPTHSSIRGRLLAAQESNWRLQESIEHAEDRLRGERSRLRGETKIAAAVGRWVWCAVLVASVVVPVGILWLMINSLASQGWSDSLYADLGLIAAFVPVIGAVWVVGERFRLFPWSAAGSEGIDV